MTTWGARPTRAAGGEHPLIVNEHLAIIVSVVLAGLTALAFALMATRSFYLGAQRVDDRFLHLMVTNRSGAATAAAKVFNLLGLTVVTLPVRIVVAGFLTWRRHWWHLLAFVVAMIVSELCIGPVKALYGRARPPGSLVTVSGTSFPSGHAIAGSVTAVAIVIVLIPPGRRAVWGAVVVAFSILMGLSRAYLAAHWLSDAAAGVLLGTATAVCTALVVQLIWNARGRSGERDSSESANPAGCGKPPSIPASP
jgi:membrane-associated phospholipid phosphatase